MTVIELSQVLGNFGEFFGAIAVVATLIYLAIQIRQNTSSMDESRRLAMTQAEQNWTAMFSDAQLRAAESQYMPAIRMKVRSEGVGALDDEQRERLMAYQIATAARLDNMLLQYQEGFLSEESYESIFKRPVRALAPLWRELEEAGGLPAGSASALGARRESFRKEIERILAEEEQPE